MSLKDIAWPTIFVIFALAFGGAVIDGLIGTSYNYKLRNYFSKIKSQYADINLDGKIDEAEEDSFSLKLFTKLKNDSGLQDISQYELKDLVTGKYNPNAKKIYTFLKENYPLK